ncbi:helix-turn-helix domain-containing protein [Micromonospora sp. NPDC007271]|uniref:winged helix-turn-helix transcriptional regulator n=1 Tax=Micromonospora sp. NPDC007271 TaxID=3154587 RepID=UPI00340324C6
MEMALAAIAGRWTTLILRDLMSGPCSFGQLRQRLPSLSAKVLADRLRELESRQLVTRERLSGFPTRTRYALTTRGRALRPLLVSLYETGTALRDLADLPR